MVRPSEDTIKRIIAAAEDILKRDVGDNNEEDHFVWTCAVGALYALSTWEFAAAGRMDLVNRAMALSKHLAELMREELQDERH